MGLLDEAKKNLANTQKAIDKKVAETKKAIDDSIKDIEQKTKIVQKEYEKNLKKSDGNVLKAGFNTAKPYAERKLNEANKALTEVKENTAQASKQLHKTINKAEQKVFDTGAKVVEGSIRKVNPELADKYNRGSQKVSQNIANGQPLLNQGFNATINAIKQNSAKAEDIERIINPAYDIEKAIANKIQNAYDTGLSNSEELAKQGGLYGLINSIGKVGYDLTYPIVHPVQTIEGLGNMITDPYTAAEGIASGINDYIDPANDYQNFRSDPLGALRTLGELGLGVKGLRSTPKTPSATPKQPIVKGSMGGDTIKGINPTPKPSMGGDTIKGGIPKFEGDKYAMAGRTQQVFPTNPAKVKGSMGGEGALKKQELIPYGSDYKPLSDEELFKMATDYIKEPNYSDTSLIEGLKNVITNKDVNQNAFNYLIKREAESRGITVEQVLDELKQKISIVDEMPFGQTDALGLHEGVSGNIYLMNKNKMNLHPQNSDYANTLWGTGVHEYTHRFIRQLIEAHKAGTLTEEGYKIAKELGIDLNNPYSENLSHIVDSLEIENPYIPNSRIESYNGRLNAAEVEKYRPIVRKNIVDYMIDQDMNPIKAEIDRVIQQRLHDIGIDYSPNTYLGNLYGDL